MDCFRAMILRVKMRALVSTLQSNSACVSIAWCQVITPISVVNHRFVPCQVVVVNIQSSCILMPCQMPRLVKRTNLGQATNGSVQSSAVSGNVYLPIVPVKVNHESHVTYAKFRIYKYIYISAFGIAFVTRWRHCGLSNEHSRPLAQCEV